MDESQDSTISLGKDIKYDGSSTEQNSMSQQTILNEFEREIQILERDIRQQKESSANAKTAITFDQLRKIHNLSRLLGPQKETFFDRICRAAEIQRASLKNRLKQNKDRFEHSLTPQSQYSQSIFDSQSSITDSQCFIATPTTIQSLFNHNSKHVEMDAPNVFDDDSIRFPADRQFELMQLGFSYDELKQLLDTFEKFKNDIQEVTGMPYPQYRQILNQFSNYISINPSQNIKLVGIAFNLLELGNTVREVKRVLSKARQRFDSESNDDDSPLPKKSCSTPIQEGSISPSHIRDEMLLGIDKSPPSDDGTQKE